MKLGIYSLQKVLFRGDAVSVNCQTENGEITILDRHAPLIATLKRGLVKIVDKNNKEHYIPLSSGFVEVRSGNEVRFLAEEAHD
jgi:F-type H+-transporting ATPase subunit epsilon